MDPHGPNLALGAMTVLVILAVVIIVQPAIALIGAGLIIILASLVSFTLGGLLGSTLGFTGIVWGIALIGFGRLIYIVDTQSAELVREVKAARADAAQQQSDLRTLLKANSEPPPKRREITLDPAELVPETISRDTRW